MAPSKKGKSKAAKSAATTTRTTRAKSKEVAAAPPPPPSRRSTRANSNEPLLHVNEPDKILRRTRKTPELQVTTAPPTPIVEDVHEDDPVAPSSPSPVVMTLEQEDPVPSSPLPVIETFEQHSAPASPSPMVESYEQVEETEPQSIVVQDVTVLDIPVQDVIAVASTSPTTSAHAPTSPAPSSLVAVAQPGIEESRYTPSPELLAAVYPAIREPSPVPLELIPRPATPTSCVHIEPSQIEQLSKTGGFFSRFTSIITTPVTKVTGFFAGAKTQPVQKVAPTPQQNTKAPWTPKYSLFSSANNVQAHDTPKTTLFADILPDENNANTETPSKEKATPFLGRITITPRRKTYNPDSTNSTTRSVLYGPDGEKIPTEYRYWPVGRCQRQAADLNTLHLLEEEVAQGVRVLSRREENFRDETLRRQYYYELWRARLPGNRAKLMPVAGAKRTTEESTAIAEETPNKRARADFTPVGYNCPTPAEPTYHHIHEDTTPKPASRLFNSGSVAHAPGFKPTARTGNGTFAVPDEDMTSSPNSDFSNSRSVANAPGFKPTVRTGNGTYAVPDFSDTDTDMSEDMSDTTPKPAHQPVNPPNWVGIPDWVYDDTSSDEEDEDSEEITEKLPTASDPSTASEPRTTSSTTAEASIPPAAPPATPFVHKYTPAKPSGLRAVQTVSSSPAILTPPRSPNRPGNLLGPELLKMIDEFDWEAAFPPVGPKWLWDITPRLDWSELASKMADEYVQAVYGTA